MVYKFKVSGLSCANCATKIESKLNKNMDFEKAIVDFTNSRVVVYSNNLSEVEASLLVEEIARNIEEGFKVILNKEKYVEEKKEFRYLIVSSIIFILFFLVNFIVDFHLFVYIGVYLILGYKLLWKSLKNIRRGQVFNEDFLMSIATLGAMFIGQYQEAMAVIIFYNVGEAFQEYSVKKSKRNIDNLIDINLSNAKVKNENGEITLVAPENLEIGNILVVNKGEKVPVDSKIMGKGSSFNYSFLTGESVPQEKNDGEEVLGGSINTGESVLLSVTKSVSDSVFGKIMNLVEDSSLQKSKTEEFITKFAKVYTPLVVFLSLGIFIIKILMGDPSLWQDYLYTSLIFLVISCPCALVISIPLSYFAGIGRCSSNGIIVRGGNNLEDYRHLNALYLDKTGTITTGNFKVYEEEYLEDEIRSLSLDINDIFKAVYVMEESSNHPISIGLINHLKNKEYDGNYFSDESKIEQHNDIREVPGKGVICNFGEIEFAVGNLALRDELDLKFGAINLDNTEIFKQYSVRDKNDPSLIIYVYVNGINVMRFYLMDEIKDDSKDLGAIFKKVNIEDINILSGDEQKIVDYVGGKLGISGSYGNLLPENKYSIINERVNNKQKKEIIGFVGDGINDAPSLKRADLSFAMGAAGSDISILAADIIVTSDQLSKIALGKQIAEKTYKIIVINIVLIFLVKILVMVLSLLGFGTLWEAILADVGVSLVAVFNSLRIFKGKL